MKYFMTLPVIIITVLILYLFLKISRVDNNVVKLFNELERQGIIVVSRTEAFA